jgi:Protein of unknown function (DUF3311)
VNAAPARRTAHRWLLLLPFIWQVALIPVVNDVPLRPLSLPFPMFWQMLGILVTTGVIGLVMSIDRRQDAAEALRGVDGAASGAGPDAGPRPVARH